MRAEVDLILTCVSLKSVFYIQACVKRIDAYCSSLILNNQKREAFVSLPLDEHLSLGGSVTVAASFFCRVSSLCQLSCGSAEPFTHIDACPPPFYHYGDNKYRNTG